MSNANFPTYVSFGSSNQYSHALLNAYQAAFSGAVNLPPWIFAMHGMSGRKYRMFINKLVSDVPSARYLEIGSWLGSTLCSAIYNNTVVACCVDNWSEFNPDGQIRTKFLSNLSLVRNSMAPVTVLEQDFNAVNYANIGKFNIYMFDGPHSRLDQYNGVKKVQDALDDEYILIVDDWNRTEVREGTFDALSELRSNVRLQVEIRTTLDGRDPPPENIYGDSDWHNGYFIAVVRKN
jgi:hypothetical protein